MLPFDPALARTPQAGLGGGASAARRRGHGRARRIRTGAALEGDARQRRSGCRGSSSLRVAARGREWREEETRGTKRECEQERWGSGVRLSPGNAIRMRTREVGGTGGRIERWGSIEGG